MPRFTVWKLLFGCGLISDHFYNNQKASFYLKIKKLPSVKRLPSVHIIEVLILVFQIVHRIPHFQLILEESISLRCLEHTAGKVPNIIPCMTLKESCM